MEVLKIAYADFWPEWSDENFIEPILKKHFNVIYDSVNPDVLFHSIFGGGREAAAYKCKKIQFLGENRRPIGTDFSISFDPPGATNFRLPLWQAFILKQPGLLDKLTNRVHHDTFERFCSFVVSNGNNFMRNGAYEQLNSYKPVRSYGRFLTNDYALQQASQERYWRDAKFEFFNKVRHKFAITYENNMHPWYCTEKLMDGFVAGSLPIYWGDPYVMVDWNQDAFINATYLPDLLKKIMELDQDSQQFEHIYSQPVFTEMQEGALKQNLASFEEWLIEKVKQ